MNIEKGDLFAVTRGHELGSASVFSLAGMFSDRPPVPEKPRYDRSLEDLVFVAEEVCGQMVAARCIAAASLYAFKAESVGRVFSLNLASIEVMTLTPEYVAALTGARP